MTHTPADLSRVVSRLLRHEAWLYELELDAEGWVPVEALLGAIRQAEPTWNDVDRDALRRMLAEASTRRHEMIGDRVRAFYGHSVPGRLLKERGDPPAVLFHGTSPTAAEEILLSGLRPMNRQYVHLSTTDEIAVHVGRRKASVPVVLRVDTTAAQRGGIEFLVGNESVWLAERVPAQYVLSDESVQPVR